MLFSFNWTLSEPYWVLTGHLGFLLASILAILFLNRSAKSKEEKVQGLYWCILVVTMFFLRLSVILHQAQINKDEGQMLVQGLTLASDPVVFRSVDPTTGGPLNSYLLSFFSLLGFRLDYSFAHGLIWVLSILNLYIIYKLLCKITSIKIASITLLPFCVFFGFTQQTDYVHYCSEITSVILLSGGTYLLATWVVEKKCRAWQTFAFGALMPLIGLAKIQALPMAFVLAIFGIFQMWPFPQRVHKILWGLSGAVLVCIAWVSFMAYHGVLDDFFRFYIQANFQYKTHIAESTVRSPFINFIRFPIVFLKNSGSFAFVLLPLAVIPFGWFRQTSHFTKIGFWGWFLAIYYCFCLIAITRTGSFYPHYYYYLILPFALSLALVFEKVEPIWYWAIMTTQVAFLVIHIKNAVLGQPSCLYPSESISQHTPVVEAVGKYTRPGDRLAVWGWTFEYYVQNQLPQGVAENHTTRSALPHPLQPVYLERYINDLARNKPRVFVDAVTSKTLWLNDPRKYSHECFKPLADFVKDHYELRETIDSIRVYVWKP